MIRVIFNKVIFKDKINGQPNPYGEALLMKSLLLDHIGYELTKTDSGVVLECNSRKDPIAVSDIAAFKDISVLDIQTDEYGFLQPLSKLDELVPESWPDNLVQEWEEINDPILTDDGEVDNFVQIGKYDEEGNPVMRRKTFREYAIYQEHENDCFIFASQKKLHSIFTDQGYWLSNADKAVLAQYWDLFGIDNLLHTSELNAASDVTDV